jgi:hypothetical protein
MCSGGGAVTADTRKATAKLTMAPTAPKAFGEMPKNQSGPCPPRNSVPGMKKMPLCWNTYSRVTVIPASMPAMAPALFIRLLKMPIISAGKIDDAARPKAMATVPAAKPGGLSPR